MSDAAVQSQYNSEICVAGPSISDDCLGAVVMSLLSLARSSVSEKRDLEEIQQCNDQCNEHSI